MVCLPTNIVLCFLLLLCANFSHAFKQNHQNQWHAGNAEGESLDINDVKTPDTQRESNVTQVETEQVPPAKLETKWLKQNQNFLSKENVDEPEKNNKTESAFEQPSNVDIKPFRKPQHIYQQQQVVEIDDDDDSRQRWKNRENVPAENSGIKGAMLSSNENPLAIDDIIKYFPGKSSLIQKSNKVKGCTNCKKGSAKKSRRNGNKYL